MFADSRFSTRIRVLLGGRASRTLAYEVKFLALHRFGALQRSGCHLRLGGARWQNAFLLLTTAISYENLCMNILKRRRNSAFAAKRLMGWMPSTRRGNSVP